MTNIAHYEPPVDTIERFQALQAGQYWKSRVAIPVQGIFADEVLLLKSIKWVDEKPHTIIMLPHPDHIDTAVEITEQLEDGSTKTHWVNYDDHKFLLDDFLAKFEFEPDFRRIRAAELAQVQGRVESMKNELEEMNRNPDILAEVVEKALRHETAEQLLKLHLENSETPDEDFEDEDCGGDTQETPAAEPPHLQDEITAALPSLYKPNNEAATLATGSLGGALTAGVNDEMISEMTVAANHQLKVVEIKANWMQSKTKAISETIQAMTPYFAEYAAAALASVEDIRVYVAKLVDGIASLHLYTGQDVKVEQICEGKSAPKDVPLTFVQRKLIMDEELSVWTDVHEMFDVGNVDVFYDALRDHPGLVQQIFPTERCVLVMATRRTSLDYRDLWTNIVRNGENKEVFLMVRDGDNIYRVDSPVESHLGASRLFPSKSDQDDVFRGIDGTNINFDDVAYTKHLAAHEKFALHYKRFLLLVCGLDHRLNLFGDFYEGEKSFQFVSMSFQSQHCRFLHDDDGSMTIGGIERIPVDEWIKQKNAFLRSGSRVLCKWSELMNPTTAPAACKPNSSGSGYYQAYHPDNAVDAVVAARSGDSICVEVSVSGQHYKNRTFNCKVNISDFKNREWDNTELPYLCLDAVDEDDLHWYIHNRGTRKDHVSYIRFFKKALAFVKKENEEQADTRRRMVEALEAGQISVGADAKNIATKAVIAWRAANRGAPLPVFTDNRAPAAWKSLLDQMYMLAGEGDRRAEAIGSFVASLGYKPLRLVVSGKAKLVVYAEPSADERDDRFTPHIWVHSVSIAEVKGKYVEKSRKWVVLPKVAASETTIKEWDEAEQWAGKESPFSSFENKAAMFEATSQFKDALTPFTTVAEDSVWEATFRDLVAVRTKFNSASRKLDDPKLLIPIGFVQWRETGPINTICINCMCPHGLLYRLAPNEQARQRMRSEYMSRYSTRNRYTQVFDSNANDQDVWDLVFVSGEVKSIFSYTPSLRSMLSHGPDPLWATKFETFRRHEGERMKFWINEAALDLATGALALDKLLGISRPADFAPVEVLMFKLSTHIPSKKDLIPFPYWYDILIDLPRDRKEKNSMLSESPVRQALRDHNRDNTDVTGMSYSDAEEPSPATARKNIQRKATQEHGFVAVEASTVAGAPQPPAGVERWYVLRADK